MQQDPLQDGAGATGRRVRTVAARAAVLAVLAAVGFRTIGDGLELSAARPPLEMAAPPLGDGLSAFAPSAGGPPDELADGLATAPSPGDSPALSPALTPDPPEPPEPPDPSEPDRPEPDRPSAPPPPLPPSPPPAPSPAPAPAPEPPPPPAPAAPSPACPSEIEINAPEPSDARIEATVSSLRQRLEAAVRSCDARVRSVRGP